MGKLSTKITVCLIFSPTVCHDGNYIDVDSDNYVVAGGLGPITAIPNIFDENDDRIYEHATNDPRVVSNIFFFFLAHWPSKPMNLFNHK